MKKLQLSKRISMSVVALLSSAVIATQPITTTYAQVPNLNVDQKTIQDAINLAAPILQELFRRDGILSYLLGSEGLLNSEGSNGNSGDKNKSSDSNVDDKKLQELWESADSDSSDLKSCTAVTDKVKQNANKLQDEANTEVGNAISRVKAARDAGDTAELAKLAKQVDAQYEKFYNAGMQKAVLENICLQSDYKDSLDTTIKQSTEKAKELESKGADTTAIKDKIAGAENIATSIQSVLTSAIALITALQSGNYAGAATIFVTIVGQLASAAQAIQDSTKDMKETSEGLAKADGTSTDEKSEDKTKTDTNKESDDNKTDEKPSDDNDTSAKTDNAAKSAEDEKMEKACFAINARVNGRFEVYVKFDAGKCLSIWKSAPGYEQIDEAFCRKLSGEGELTSKLTVNKKDGKKGCYVEYAKKNLLSIYNQFYGTEQTNS